MIYPNIDSTSWINFYPGLSKALGLKCLCGHDLIGHKPYMTTKSVGIVTGHCESCSAPGVSVSMLRKKEENAKHAEALRTIFGAN